jgi:hypothetical protein
LYEVQVRAGAPRTAIRSANDGSFERGEGVLAMLLGVSAGRFVIEPDESPCRGELTGSLHEQLAGPVARARAAQRALSAGALVNVTRVAFDATRVGAYLECTPEPAQSLLRELISGASPRELLTSGRAPARLLEALLSDFARRGGVLTVETASGVEDISQTRVPPTVAPPLAALSVPEPEPEPVTAAVLREPPAPVSQRKPPAIYSQPPDAELASADAGWFSFQIEASGKPPEVAAEPTPVTEDVAEAELLAGTAPVAPAVVPRAEDPLRRTLTSSSAPRANEAEDALPGASVPVERGYRPEPRTDTLGSAGNEAAAAVAAVATRAEPVVAVVETARQEPAPMSAPAEALLPVAKPPRPLSPSAPHVIDDDPLAQALVGTPAPVEVAPTPPLAPGVKAEAPAPLSQTLPLEHAPRPAADESEPAEARARSPWRSDGSTPPTAASKTPPTAGSKTAVMPVAKAPPAAKRAAKVAPVQPSREADSGGWGRTVLFALIAAGVSYWGVTAVFGSGPATPSEAVPSSVTPVPQPVVSSALAPRPPKLAITITEAPLPPDTDMPPNNGLLEIQVPDGTAIRVDGEYLGMGPARRVPLAPGAHQLALGDSPAQSVEVKQGQRTVVVVADGAQPAPAGSP